MPSAWRKAKLGEVPRILASAVGSRAKRGVGDSGLVLQAGFPTSVADLVVKNRGRITRKAPKWLRRQRYHGRGEADVAPCSVVSEVVAAKASGDVCLPPVSAPQSMEAKRVEEEAQSCPVVATVEARWDKIAEEGLGSSRPGEDVKEPRDGEFSASEVSTTPKPESDILQARNRRRFVMPSNVGFLVFVLAIGTQRIAFGASISAFIILLLDSLARRPIPFSLFSEGFKKKTSDIVGGIPPVPLINGRIPVQNLPVFSGSNVVCTPSHEDTTPILALARKDRVEEEQCRRDRKGRNSGTKAKKLLKKFVPKKLWGSNVEKGQKAEPTSDCGCERASAASPHASEGEELPREEEDDGTGGDRNKDDEEESRETLVFVVSAGVQDVGFRVAAFMVENHSERAKGNPADLVFFLIILFGLFGGRTAAMMLTVLWCLLVSFARGLCKCSKIPQKPLEDCELASIKNFFDR